MSLYFVNFVFFVHKLGPIYVLAAHLSLLLLFNIMKIKIFNYHFCIGGGWGIKVQLADKNTLLQLPEERLVA